MRPTFLKQSMLEPNFAFALGSDTQVGSPSPDSAEFHSDHSDFALHKAEKPIHNYRMSSGETLTIARTLTSGGAPFRQKLYAHCQVKWALYIILTLGFVSISGCIAAGVALAAVQPYLVEDPATTLPPPLILFPKRIGSAADQAAEDDQSTGESSGTTTDLPPDLLTHIFSTIRDAGMQASSSLELRNATQPPIAVTDGRMMMTRSSSDYANPAGESLAAPSIREFFASLDFEARGDTSTLPPTYTGPNYNYASRGLNSDSPVVSSRMPVLPVLPVLPAIMPIAGSQPSSATAGSRLPVVVVPVAGPAGSRILPLVQHPHEHLVETIPERDKLVLFQQTARYNTIQPATGRTGRHNQLVHFDDKREPDRFPDPVRGKAADPLMQDLNITFVESSLVLPRKPLVVGASAQRSLRKRAVAVVGSGRDKPAPALNLGRFTMMQPGGVKVMQVHTAGKKIDIAGEGRPLEPKALVPDVMLSGMCEAGFEWNPVARDCHDVDECLQMGIRACGVHSECTNIPGTFTCRCSPGFRLDPKTLVCTDIDECKESNGECSPLAQCENIPGGFLCRCSDGFYGNGIVCEIDGSGIIDRHDPMISLPCQTSLPPRSHQVVSSPYYPEPFPVHSRYKFCVQKLQGICKIAFTVLDFVPSTASHQDFDHLTMQGKVLTGTDQNGQKLWLLDSGESPVEIEFATDSDIKGNRFTLEIAQEQCGQTLSVPECADLLNVEGSSLTSAGPHYIDNLACTTALYPPNDACGMELKFHEFSLEGPRETCLYDYLEVYDDKMCGNLKNEQREIIFPRSTQKIPIIFSTDGSFVSLGFNITYTWITECYQ